MPFDRDIVPIHVALRRLACYRPGMARMKGHRPGVGAFRALGFQGAEQQSSAPRAPARRPSGPSDRRLGGSVTRRTAPPPALTFGRQDTLAVLLHRHGAAGSELTSALLDGIAEGAAEARQRLDLSLVSSTTFMPRPPGPRARRRRRGPRLRRLSRRRDGLASRKRTVAACPSSRSTATAHHDELPNVGCSDHAVGRLAYEHLAQAGARRIVLHRRHSRQDGRRPGRRR